MADPRAKQAADNAPSVSGAGGNGETGRVFTVLAAGVAALTLGGAPGAARAQAPSGPGSGPGNPAVAMREQRATLLQQCPPLEVLSEADAAKLPIHVTKWGTSGPAVLVIHGGVQGGLGGGPSTFSKQEALAQRGWQLSVVDRPGFGQSQSRGPDDMMADSVWIADMLGSGTHMMAHSWGAAEALLAVARRPEAVKSLILVEPALEALLPTDPSFKDNPVAQAAIGGRVRQLLGAKSPAEYGLSFATSLGTADTGDSAPNAVAAAFAADPAQAARVGCALLRARMAPPEAFKAAVDAVAKAGIPVLVISGGWSPAYNAVGDLVAKMARGRHVIVKSPSHFVQLASAEAFNEVVDTFMREAEQAPRTPR